MPDGEEDRVTGSSGSEHSNLRLKCTDQTVGQSCKVSAEVRCGEISFQRFEPFAAAERNGTIARSLFSSKFGTEVPIFVRNSAFGS